MGAGAGTQCNAITWYSECNLSEAEKSLDEEAWFIGGRYMVSGPTQAASLWQDPDCNGAPCASVALAPFLLLDVSRGDASHGGALMGLVRSARSSQSGWLHLEDSSSKPCTLHRYRLANSWRKGGTYQTVYPCTLRQGAELSSRWLEELAPRTQVIALKFGTLCLSSAVDWTQVRLRMCVRIKSHGEERTGWISPETADGYQLLSQVLRRGSGLEGGASPSLQAKTVQVEPSCLLPQSGHRHSCGAFEDTAQTTSATSSAVGLLSC
mmetsp:Transcript_69953/g.167926  ORF Transcript_69953/g.167926 Transcript_69953/m.167926 type:complete len:266 (+) Transcript_69953:39-836(+)